MPFRGCRRPSSRTRSTSSRRLGLALRLYAVKREPEPKVHPVVAAIRAPLLHLPKASSLSGQALLPWLRSNLPAFGAAPCAGGGAPSAALGPGALATALGLAWQHRRRDADCRLQLRKVYIKEFLQAGAIADDVLRAGGVGHLHGHFCHGVATITWLAARMAGLGYSFTAHAKDIYQPDLNPGDLLERKMHGARFVATCTCANAGVLRLRHPRPAEVHAIYHGLDTDWFAPAAAQQAGSDQPPLVLAVGRFVEKKGFDQLVEACALLQQRGVAFRALIVGEDGPARSAVQAAIDRHGLQDRFLLHGVMTQDALRTLYAQARLFALPCQVMDDGDRDGFPNVLAESMAMGVPVVTTNISGIPEMIDDGQHGLLVPPRSPVALADALQRVLTDDALWSRLAQGGRSRMVACFDSRQTTVALRDLFAAQLPPAPAGGQAAQATPAGVRA